MNRARNIFPWAIGLLLIVGGIAGMVHAQGVPTAPGPHAAGPPGIDPAVVCLGIGAIISWAVAALKKTAFVGKNPKWTATIFAVVIAIAQNVVFGAGTWGQFFTCVVTQLVAAIGTHEVINNSVPVQNIKAALKSDGT